MQLFLVVVRVLVALTAVQMTGFPHAVADVVIALQSDGGHHEDEDCPYDKDGRECPPGCPSCHCVHLMGALPPLAPPVLIELPTVTELGLVPYEAQAPPGLALPALYRPPRPTRA